MTTPNTAVQIKEEKAMEYVPFGAADKIKLTAALIMSTVCIPTKSGKVCTVRDAVRFMMLCQAQRLNPFAGDCFLCGYDSQKSGPVFSMITAHQAFLKRAETCLDFEGMESGIILVNEDGICADREGDFKLPDEKCVGGWAKVYRKGRKVTLRRLSIAAMIPNYDTPFWSEHKAPGQIVKCAEADALRATFPTLLGGLYGQEELMSTVSVVSGSAGAIDLPQIPIGQPQAAITDTAQQVSDPAEKKEPVKLTPQQELEGVITAAGHSFADLIKWGVDTGNIPEADSLTQMSEVPTAIAARLLKAQKGLLAGLAAAKGGAQ